MTNLELSAQPSITCVILTFNEEIHIERCIRSALRVASRICIVDSSSTDRTVEIAKSLGAAVLSNPWKNYADQFQWAIDNSDITSDWVMRLDADEYVDDDLVEEIANKFPKLSKDIQGVVVRRKVFFKGRWIKWGGYYPTYLLRLWRRDGGRIEQRWMDEHIVVDGPVERFSGHIVDADLKDFHFWIDKHNKYATRTMLDFINLDTPLFPADASIMRTDNAQARRKRFLKESVFHRLPIYMRPFFYFFYRYFILLGVLDGKWGLVFHFNHALWFRLLESVKIDEARAYIAAHGVEAFKRHIHETNKLDI